MRAGSMSAPAPASGPAYLRTSICDSQNGGWHFAVAPSGAVKITSSLVTATTRDDSGVVPPCLRANEAIQPGKRSGEISSHLPPLPARFFTTYGLIVFTIRTTDTSPLVRMSRQRVASDITVHLYPAHTRPEEDSMPPLDRATGPDARMPAPPRRRPADVIPAQAV